MNLSEVQNLPVSSMIRRTITTSVSGAAIPYFRWSDARFQPRKFWFNPRAVHVELFPVNRRSISVPVPSRPWTHKCASGSGHSCFSSRHNTQTYRVPLPQECADVIF